LRAAVLYRFNDIEIDPSARELRKGGAVLEVEPRVLDLLLYLVERKERVVGKRELLDAVWEGRIVSDAAMARAIHSARKLIGDPEAIRTFYGRGYRFVAASPAETAPSRVDRSAHEEAPRSKSISSGRSPSPLLVGRDSDLALAAECLDAALQGQTRGLIMTGEAGVGKTALCERIAQISTERGVLAVWGRCSEVPGAPAYWPFTQVLRSIGERLPSERREELLEAYPKVRELLSPSGLSLDATGDAEQARFRLFDSIAQFLRAAAAGAAFAIVVDDLHCADTPSLLLFHFLMQQLKDARLLLVAAYRDAEMRSDPARLRWLGDLLRQPGVRTMALRGLDATEVGVLWEAFTGSRASPSTVEYLVDQTAGNPFYLSRLIPLLNAHEEISSAVPSGQDAELPRSLRDAVESQLANLPGETRRVLDVAAVIGRELDIAVLATALGASYAAVFAAMDPARASGLVARTGESRMTLRFGHVIVRDTIYTGLTDASRGDLHRRVGEAYETLHDGQLDDVASELSHHYAYATGPDASEKAIRYSIAAGEVALNRLAYEDATRELERATAALMRTPDRDERLRCDVLLELASAYTRSGHLDSARKIFRQAADLARRIQEPERLAMVAMDLAPGFFSIETSHVDEYLIERLEEALQVLGDTDSVLRARLLSRLAIALYWTDQKERRIRLCEEAAGIAERTGSAEAHLPALIAQHAALWSPYNWNIRLEWSRELIELSAQADDSDALLVSRCFRISDLLEHGDMSAVREEIERFRTLAHAMQQPECIWMSDMYDNMLALARGEFARVEQFGIRSIELGQRIRHHNAVQTGGVYIGLTRCETSGLEEFIPVFESNMETYPLASWAGLHTMACARGGDDERTRRSLVRSLELLPKEPPNLTWLPAIAMMCEAAAHLDAGNEAEKLDERLAPIESRYLVIGYGIALCGALTRSLGLLAFARERWTDAVVLLEDAIEKNGRLGLEPYVAHTRRELSRTLVRRGLPRDRARANRLLEQSLATGERLGMTWLLRQGRAMSKGRG
jgi:DNA-binding winged helix-turn-helix (wHTH) protein/tetratricopeptide (TPR) repeat protein